MSGEVFLNPEQLQDRFNRVEKMLTERFRDTEFLSPTSQYSTQVNMDEEFQSFESTIEKKKNRKKEYKRKKKQKRKEEEESARIKLANIIKQIYEGATNFQDSKNAIETHLAQLIGGEKFHMFLNEAIKIHVKNMQKDIWDFMQSIIKQNSLQKNSDDQDFYLQMIEFIYTLYRRLRASSQEIQKIINLFMRINSNSDQYVEDQYGLDRSTFKFMVDSDDTIKNLLKICRRRILPLYSLEMEHIIQLTQMISRSELENIWGEEQQTTQKSTSVDEEQQQRQSGKRKRRKKLKQSDFSCDIQQVIRRLNQMVIQEDKRFQCGTSEDWARNLKQRFNYYE